MKNKFLLIVAVTATFFSIPTQSISQVINLGTAANFVLFTSVGAIGNTAISQITGDVGTNSGGTTGFGNVNGVMHSGDGATASATNNLLTAYQQLNNSMPTNNHAPLLGNGETLTAGVYDISGVTVLSNVLTLDAQGNSNAVFIFKISAAFSSAASSQVRLVNGALACNVFWKVEGAATLGSLTVMKGNIVAHNDQIDVASGASLDGRLLAINGAVTVNSITAKAPTGCGTAILNGPAAPDLGSTVCYGILSGNEDVSNSGTTTVKGDVGTNVGLTTGYDALLVDGTIHPIPDGSTNAAAADLLTLRTYLNALTADIELLYPAQFGRSLVLTPHTYLLNAGTSFTDTLFLNAEGNANAVFVIKIYGALSTGTAATVSLVNSAQAKNVFWIVNGAVTIGANADIKGTIVSNNGAINLMTGVRLQGRAMTTNGALTTSAVSVSVTTGCASLPLSLISFSGKWQGSDVILGWKTANEQNTALFQVQQSIDGRNYIAVGSVSAAGTSSTANTYSFTHNHAKDINSNTLYYRLKMIDVDGHFTYSSTVSLQVKQAGIEFMFYPNPVRESGIFCVSVKNREQITYVIADNFGKVVRTGIVILQMGVNTIDVNVKSLTNGVYYIQVQGKTTNERLQFIKQ